MLRSDFYLFGSHYVVYLVARLLGVTHSLSGLRLVQLCLTVLGATVAVVLGCGLRLRGLAAIAAVVAGLAIAPPFLLQVPFGALRPEPLLFAASFAGVAIALGAVRDGLTSSRALSLAVAIFAMTLAKQQGVALAGALLLALWWVRPEARRRVAWCGAAGIGAAAVAIVAYDLWSGGALRFWCVEVPSRQWWTWGLWWSHSTILVTHGAGPLVIAAVAGWLAHRAGRLESHEITAAAVVALAALALGVPLAGKISTSAWSAYLGVFVVLYLTAAVWALRAAEKGGDGLALLPFLLLAVEVLRVSQAPGPEVVAPPVVEAAVRRVEERLLSLDPPSMLAVGDTWVPFSVTAATRHYPESLNLILQVADPAYQARYLQPALQAIRRQEHPAIVLWTIPSLVRVSSPGASWLTFAHFNRLNLVREVRASAYTVRHRETVTFTARGYEAMRRRLLRALGWRVPPPAESVHEYVYEILTPVSAAPAASP